MTFSDSAPVVFGLLSALSWGAGDFSGGLASKRSNVYSVVMGSQFIGMLLLIGLAVVFGEAVPSLASWLWGGLAGAAGAVGLMALYRALAIGRMGVAAPVSAVISGALPVLIAAWVEGLPGALQLIGFGLALVGVWLLSRNKEALLRAGDLGLPAVAGLGFGLFFVFIDRVSEPAVFWPLVAARLASLSLLFLVAWFNRQPALPGRPHLPLVALAGVLDAGGNAFFVLATRTGRLDVASVLSSLYPASTVALAWLLLKEQLTRSQWFGVAAVLAAIVLIALPKEASDETLASLTALMNTALR
jgi:drug/metabolite transporter (DMT)-like permease